MRTWEGVCEKVNPVPIMNKVFTILFLLAIAISQASAVGIAQSATSKLDVLAVRASNDVVLADPHPIRPPSVTADAEVSSFQVEDKKILLSGDSESMMPAGDAEATTPGLIQLAVDDSTSVSSDDDVSIADDSWVSIIVVICVVVGFVVALVYTHVTSKIQIVNQQVDLSQSLLQITDARRMNRVHRISSAIAYGADQFIYAEYLVVAQFMAVFSLLLLVVLGFVDGWDTAALTVVAFWVGALTSCLSGFLGMRIATYANSRTAVSCQGDNGISKGFVVSYRAGAVMGFALSAMGILMLYILILVYSLYWDDLLTDSDAASTMFDCIAGYGLGGSSIALFGRVGGGIYTKAADVGADLCKIEYNMDEDSAQNPAVIADNVGDNVGDIAGMGADLFGSFAESSCAVMVVIASSDELYQYWPSLCLPLIVSSFGILVSLATSFFATHINPPTTRAEVEPVLKMQLVISTVLMTPMAFIACYYFLPTTSFTINTTSGIHGWHIFLCTVAGLYSGLIIGYSTEYYTSNANQPVQDLARSTVTGAATNIIYGLSLGYISVIIPIICLCITIYIGWTLGDMLGVGMAAIGILSTMAIGLTIDAFGPICDNAGGIAEMANLPEEVRDNTDALDAAGNTTAAIGKGFAIGSAALVSLALFGAFTTTVNLSAVDLLSAWPYAGLLFGSMLPYWFSGLTMRSVGAAANAMVLEVRRQFDNNPALLEFLNSIEDCTEEEIEQIVAKREDANDLPLPDYQQCINVSTNASLREMIAPGVLVMVTPLVVGYLFGISCLAGMLAGALVSGVQMAISMSNTGGAWDNAKKFVEAKKLIVNGQVQGKGSACHMAAVIGDTVGDPMKDTSGPALNILVKLSAITSLVFASTFPTTGYLEQLFS